MCDYTSSVIVYLMITMDTVSYGGFYFVYDVLHFFNVCICRYVHRVDRVHHKHRKLREKIGPLKIFPGSKSLGDVWGFSNFRDISQVIMAQFTQLMWLVDEFPQFIHSKAQILEDVAQKTNNPDAKVMADTLSFAVGLGKKDLRS